MYQRTTRFDEATKQSHHVKVQIDVYDKNGTLVQADLAFDDGQLTVDDTDVHRTCDLSIVDHDGDLRPINGTDLLAPGQNELLIRRGIVYPDGTEELLNLGLFHITDVHMDDAGPSLNMSLDLSDRAHRVALAQLKADTVIPAGTTFTNAIATLVRSGINAPLNFFQTTAVTGRLVYEAGADPWAEASKLAAAIGCTLYFDPSGTCVLKLIPNPDTLPVSWTFTEDVDCTMVYTNRRLTDDGVYNWIVVYGESSSNSVPVRGEAMDTDPLSSTYVNGPFGQRRNVITRSNVFSIAQANAAAFGELQKSRGIGELSRMQAMVHPAFEIGDKITIKRGRSGMSGDYVIDKMSYPLVYDRAMDISAQKRRLV